MGLGYCQLLLQLLHLLTQHYDLFAGVVLLYFGQGFRMLQLPGEFAGSGWTLDDDLVVVGLGDSQLHRRVAIHSGGELGIVMFLGNRLILIRAEL